MTGFLIRVTALALLGGMLAMAFVPFIPDH